MSIKSFKPRKNHSIGIGRPHISVPRSNFFKLGTRAATLDAAIRRANVQLTRLMTREQKAEHAARIERMERELQQLIKK